MRRVIDEFRQLPIEIIAELLVYAYRPLDEDEDVYGNLRYTSNLLHGSYPDEAHAIDAVIKYFERSV